MKRTWTLVVMLAFTAAMASPVNAATVIEFDPDGGSPGERITGKTVGAGMQGVSSGRVRVFLASSNRAADLAAGPEDPRLVAFGVLTSDEKDVGHFVGRVPAIAPGSYIAVAYCRECAAGGAVFTVGEFEVRAPLLPRTGAPIVLWIAIAASLVAFGIRLVRARAALTRRQREASRKPEARH